MTSHISCSSFQNPDTNESAVLSTVDSLNFTVPLSCAINIWLDGVKTGLGAEKTKVLLVYCLCSIIIVKEALAIAHIFNYSGTRTIVTI